MRKIFDKREERKAEETAVQKNIRIKKEIKLDTFFEIEAKLDEYLPLVIAAIFIVAVLPLLIGLDKFALTIYYCVYFAIGAIGLAIVILHENSIRLNQIKEDTRSLYYWKKEKDDERK